MVARFEDVLPALRKGKRVRRKGDSAYQYDRENLAGSNVLADDWEVVEERCDLLDEALVRRILKDGIADRTALRLADNFLSLKAVADAVMLTDWDMLPSEVQRALRGAGYES